MKLRMTLKFEPQLPGGSLPSGQLHLKPGPFPTHLEAS